MGTTTARLCDHGYPYYLCHDLQSPEVREAVDFSRRFAYDYASQYIGSSDFPDTDAAEDFARFVADDTARREGAMDGDDMPSMATRWRLSKIG